VPRGPAGVTRAVLLTLVAVAAGVLLAVSGTARIVALLWGAAWLLAYPVRRRGSW
jgi:hypothetical protein